MRPFALLVAASLLAGCAQAQDFNDAPPNAGGQSPAFQGQTRAPALPDAALQRQVVVAGLEHPWGMAQMPDGNWLVTERPGRLRLVSAGGALSAPVAGLPAIHARGQGGLLDVAIGDDFAETRRLWISFAEPHPGGQSATAVATGTLSADGGRLEDARVIWRQSPLGTNRHYGSRLVFDNRGGLFVATGERGGGDGASDTQDVGSTIGKVVRIDPLSGAPMGDSGIAGARPEMWSYGHRNPQGAALGPDGALWTVEHGAKGGDELNRPRAGGNYGWPLVTYGIDYSGRPIGENLTSKPGVEQPVYYWDPVIAPGGMAFYDGAMFPDWRGDLLIGGLVAGALIRLELAEGRVTGEARHLRGIGRVRDVDIAADGAIMLLTDEADGALIRVTPGG